MKLRLLGLRCTNLVSTKKAGINFFGAAAVQARPISAERHDLKTADHEITAEEAFEGAARQEIQDEMNDLEQLSQEAAILPDATVPTGPDPPPAQWDCPICGRAQTADDRVFNDHVDFCLSRQTIREAIQDSSEPPEETTVYPNRKRKPISQASSSDIDPRQKRLFFH